MTAAAFDLAHLAFAVALIVLVARAAGSAAAALGQPRVIGELCGGIALGPSLLGAIAPTMTDAVFADDVRGMLNVLAQVGLVAFMFWVGLEIDTGRLRRSRLTWSVATTSLVVPAVLAVPVALVAMPAFIEPGATGASFVVFICIALSITALPVLARIIEDAGLGGERIATVALVAGAATDAAAWLVLLALGALVADGGLGGAAGASLVAGGFLVAAFALLAPLIRTGVRGLEAAGTPRRAAGLGLVGAGGLSVLALIAGLPVLAGGLIVGFSLRNTRGEWRAYAARVDRASRAVLLPLFFAVVGLGTDLTGILGNGGVIVAGALCLAVTLVGKAGACSLMAYRCGAPRREAAGIGVLLSTKGVTEIIVLKIGLDMGIINAACFAILEVVAIACTAMALPMLRLLSLTKPVSSGGRLWPRRLGQEAAAAAGAP